LSNLADPKPPPPNPVDSSTGGRPPDDLADAPPPGGGWKGTLQPGNWHANSLPVDPPPASAGSENPQTPAPIVIPSEREPVGDPGAKTTRDWAAGDTWDATTGSYALVNKDRFNKLRSHARGLLGEVFLAQDKVFNRNVAVTELPSDRADDAEFRTSFIHEADITGSLEHSGVAPVYALGKYADGRPFYATRLLEGTSMETAIDRFHAAGGMSRANGQKKFRELLAKIVEACNTIAYAHKSNVVHRDLKPSNVMLCEFGQTFVVGWGLAIRIGEQDVVAIRSSGSAETVQYISPEQAKGNHAQVDARSDVYSLGAVLYRLLTGKTAFAAGDLNQTTEAIRTGRFTRPGQVQPGIPKAMESICLKAMSVDPNDRYANVEALADDISNWLADEPITARTEPVVTRLRRWIRRRFSP
jgi:serine/threonine protein kinase